MEVFEMTAMISLFGIVGYTARTAIVNLRRHRTARLQAEVMSKLIDRIGSSPELGRWLENEGPQQFLQMDLERSHPAARILNSIQAGLITLSLGIGLHWIGRYEETLVAGTILTAVGIGFLASSVAAYALSRSWGIMKGSGPKDASGDVQ
jgi:hypothetical protein